MQELKCTAFGATPTYVLGMADTARKMGIDPRSIGIQRITCAGEPGASIPTTKQRIEEAWGAKVYDHIGGHRDRGLELLLYGPEGPPRERGLLPRGDRGRRHGEKS